VDESFKDFTSIVALLEIERNINTKLNKKNVNLKLLI